ncbi:MAG: hypothetical protein OXC28_07660 [Defluviicoccus sp.]|nr:hypothetical protein [Defluviicoccus sp.]
MKPRGGDILALDRPVYRLIPIGVMMFPGIVRSLASRFSGKGSGGRGGNPAAGGGGRHRQNHHGS